MQEKEPINPVILTSRGKRLATFAGFLGVSSAVVITVFGLKSCLQEEFKPSPCEQAIEVIVNPGDTLWDISRNKMPGVDPREGVAAIENCTPGELSLFIKPGQTLQVPIAVPWES